MKSGRTAAAKGFFVDTMSSKTVRGFAMQAVYFLPEYWFPAVRCLEVMRRLAHL